MKPWSKPANLPNSVITELHRLIYTYSEYFHAQWANWHKNVQKNPKNNNI